MTEFTDKELLNLFREFVLQNATQWKMGSNHHHPIWSMVAELIGDEEKDINSGPLWKFIQPENKFSLQYLFDTNEKTKDCPYCEGRGIVWKGGQFGDYERCECVTS